MRSAPRFAAITAIASGMFWATAPASANEPSGSPQLPSLATSLPAQSEFADLRLRLAAHGIVHGLLYTGEILGNPSGGARQGGLYQGRLEGFLAVDLEKSNGWQGLNFFTNAFQIHRSSGPRDQHFDILITISNIEATPSTRLSELWLEQKLFNDRFGVRFGQIAADAEFFISEVSKLFISSDWPTIAGANLPSGGPAYPLATPGVRLKFDPTPHWSVLLGLFNGDPGDQATVNRYGTNFRINDPPLLMGELQYRYTLNTGAAELAGAFRMGGWYHFGTFESLAIDVAGDARLIRGTSGIYGIIDQQIYRPPGGDAANGISVFSRVAAAPSDRSVVDFYLDGGIVFAGLTTGRPNDSFGASFTYAHLSNQAQAFERNLVIFSEPGQPNRNYELTVEVTYQALLAPGWTMQPVFQYIVHPGGHIVDPIQGIQSVKSGALFGLRSTITY